MRSTIIILTGIAIGIIVSISSTNADSFKTRTYSHLYQSFTRPAIASVGTVVDSTKKYITVSFEGSLVHFLMTKDTKVNKYIKQDSGYIYVEEKNLVDNGTSIYITYLEDENKLYADRIFLHTY